VTVTAQIAVAEIVAKNDHEVRPIRSNNLRGKRRTQQGSQEENSGYVQAPLE
jgi:hypothetical protein